MFSASARALIKLRISQVSRDSVRTTAVDRCRLKRHCGNSYLGHAPLFLQRSGWHKDRGGSLQRGQFSQRAAQRDLQHGASQHQQQLADTRVGRRLKKMIRTKLRHSGSSGERSRGARNGVPGKGRTEPSQQLPAGRCRKLLKLID